MVLSSVVRLSFAIVSVLAFASCGGSDSTTPTAVTPSPTPTATPAPTPTPARACTLAAMPDCGASGCCEEGGEPLFDSEIQGAQAAVRQSRPDWFDADGSMRISDVEYTAAVAQKLTELYGLCARGGDDRNPPAGHSISSDEVGVKRDNGVSQNVDIVIGATNQPAIMERFTCSPASF